MAHEIAKLVLEHAESFLERSQAIKTALSLGMPLSEIEGYLDWLAMVRTQRPANKQGADSPQPSSPESSES